MRQLGLIFSLTALLAACGLAQLDQQPEIQTTSPSFVAAQRELWIHQPLLAMPGHSSREAIARLGMPLRQASREIVNPSGFDARLDQWIELEYPQLRLGYYRNGASGQETLAWIRLSGEDYELRPGLQLGDDLERFEQVIGGLKIEGPNRYLACDGRGRGDCLRLRVEDDRVVQLEQEVMLD
ncbi:MAG TPA: hypothetical protein V6D23_17950 [Candidatus Obscuribacterales bacterium]